MVDLPFDILWKVFEYLPADESMKLRSVNRLFLELARKIHYRDLHLVTYTKRTKQLLKGIK